MRKRKRYPRFGSDPDWKVCVLAGSNSLGRFECYGASKARILTEARLAARDFGVRRYCIVVGNDNIGFEGQYTPSGKRVW